MRRFWLLALFVLPVTIVATAKVSDVAVLSRPKPGPKGTARLAHAGPQLRVHRCTSYQRPIPLSGCSAT